MCEPDFTEVTAALIIHGILARLLARG